MEAWTVAKDKLYLIIGTVYEIGNCGDDVLVYAYEFKSDLLSSCKKLIPKNNWLIIKDL